MQYMSVVTRFPPSPTGPLHIGNVRTGLFSYLYAQKHGGLFIVRVEDTDKARSTKEFERMLLNDIDWLGLKRDNTEIWRQSERTEVYKKYLHKLIDEGKAYISQETEGENKEVVRFKNPNKRVIFQDLVRGEIGVDTTDLGDFIIARNINDPIYHMAVVVDDFEAGVTHVIRGEDHISNTPRQILIQEAIGAVRPVYAHLPLIVASDHSKLSKRKHGVAVSLDYYRTLGFLPVGIVNYLALLGWNPGTEQEIFTLDELKAVFAIEQVQNHAAIFDIIKLRWVNREHMLKMSEPDFVAYAKDYVSEGTAAVLPKLVSVMRERASTFGDIQEADQAGEFRYFHSTPVYEAPALLWKQESQADTKRRLEAVLGLLEPVLESQWTTEGVKSAVWPYAESEGRGQVLWPLRMSLSGREKSPDPFVIAGIIGRDETLKRISAAVSCLSL